MQVDPIKPKLKPPGSNRLKLKCKMLLSSSAFNFNLRRYAAESGAMTGAEREVRAAMRVLKAAGRTRVKWHSLHATSSTERVQVNCGQASGEAARRRGRL